MITILSSFYLSLLKKIQKSFFYYYCNKIINIKQAFFSIFIISLLSFSFLIIFRIIYFLVICSIFKVYNNLPLIYYLWYSVSNDFILLFYIFLISSILFSLFSYYKKIPYILKSILLSIIIFLFILPVYYFYQFEVVIDLEPLAHGLGGFSKALLSSALFEIPYHFYIIIIVGIFLISLIISFCYLFYKKQYSFLKYLPLFLFAFWVSLTTIWSFSPKKDKIDEYIQEREVFHNLTLPFYTIVENPIVKFFSFYLKNKDINKAFTNKKLTKEFNFQLNTHSIVKHENLPSVSIPKNKKYNIIFYVLESTSQDYLGIKYNKKEITPNLNKIQQNSFISENHYTHYPLSINSIITLLSSSYEPPSNDWVSVIAPHIKVQSLFEALNNIGYQTAIFHSGELKHFYLKRYLRKRTIHKMVDSMQLRNSKYESFMFDWSVDDRAMINPIVSFANKTSKKKQPFFITVLPLVPHHPYQVPSNNFKILSDKYINKAVKKKDTIRDKKREARWLRYLNALYYSDYVLGQLIYKLEQKSLLDDTLVFIVADHGEAFFQHKGNYLHALFLYEENVKTPLLVYNKKIFPQTISYKGISRHIDILPTIFDILNIPLHKEHEGTSLFSAHPQQLAYLHTHWLYDFIGIRDSDYKYIYDVLNNKEELYNIENDALEKNNIVKEHPLLAKRFRDFVLRARDYKKSYYQTVLDFKKSPKF